jgi:anthranilate synthase component 1
MLNKLSESAFVALAKQNERVVVFEELAGDNITPISVYQQLKAHMAGATLLESQIHTKRTGRFSFIGFNPRAEIRYRKDNHELVSDQIVKSDAATPLDQVEYYYQQLRATMTHPLQGFSGGMVGYFGYDAIRYIEDIPDNNAQDNEVPDIVLKFYRDHFAFDHQTGTVVLSTVVDISVEQSLQYQEAMAHIANYKKLLSESAVKAGTDKQPVEDVGLTPETDIDDETFKALVLKAKQKICDGEIFQVVLSRSFKVAFSAEPFDIYRALRLCSPSPYMFFIDEGDFVILGASPEKLVSTDNGIIETRALAGTRPRGDKDTDVSLAIDLKNDPKEQAEHTMLVDLARNDIGRVATVGSVKVKQLMEVERFSHVMHLCSTIQGEISPTVKPLEALLSAFPAGTLSGAPKIRAMQLIDELETNRRGVYGGSICMVDSKGDVNSCIAIRMGILHNNIATIRAGAGVVYDSDPQKEADETRAKAKSVLHAIAMAEGGLK